MAKEKKTKADAQAPVDLEQVKKDLVAKAKKAGNIDQRDITTAIPDVPANADLLDKLYTELADNNIQVQSAVGETEEPTEMSDEWALEDNEEVVPEDQHYLD